MSQRQSEAGRSDPLRVLFLSHAADFYGACRSLYDVLASIDRSAFVPHLVCPWEGLLTEKARGLDVPTFVVPSQRWTETRSAWRSRVVNLYGTLRVARLIRKHRIDLVYTNSGLVTTGALAARLTRRPHIWHVREAVSPRSEVLRRMPRLSNLVIANSSATRERIPADGKTPIVTLYNGFRPEEYACSPRQRAEARSRYGIEDHETVLSLVGLIGERKGQRELLLALPSIRKEHPHVRVCFAGKRRPWNRGYEDELQAIIRRFGLERAVLFAGFQEDVSEIYRLSDLLVVPSRYEAFGRVVVEGMLAGLPVLATRVNGIPEIIDDEETGILIDSRAPEVIARATNALLRDPERMARLAENGKRVAAQRFSMQEAIRRLEGLIRDTYAASA